MPFAVQCHMMDLACSDWSMSNVVTFFFATEEFGKDAESYRVTFNMLLGFIILQSVIFLWPHSKTGSEVYSKILECAS